MYNVGSGRVRRALGWKNNPGMSWPNRTMEVSNHPRLLLGTLRQARLFLAVLAVAAATAVAPGRRGREDRGQG